MKIENGNVILDLSDLLAGILNTLGETEREDALQTIACNEAVIKYVVQQIVDGATDNGSYGATSLASSTPRLALDCARRQIAREASEVAAAEVERLELALRLVEQRASTAERRVDRMLNHIQDHYGWDTRSGFFDATYDDPKAVQS